MVKVISVKFRGNCRSYYFDPGEYDIPAGSGVIVETARGEEYGDVVEGVKELEESLVPAALKPIIRPATEEDARLRQEFIAKESDAFMLCQERIADHKLDMKLVDVEYTYNGSKIVFYFTADERVDFRDLVKDLAYSLRTRIELRQIGVRDEAKMLGGLGPCGRPVCCNAFLDDFRPVSIKMAKEQNLSLSPTKISGLCGRLMCCLQYEQYAYEEAHKRLPRVGKELETPEGVGIVTECNVLTERVKVRLSEEDGSFEIKEFACAEVGPGTFGKQPEPKQAAEGTETAAPVSVKQPAENTEEKKPARNEEQRNNRPRRERPRRERSEGNKEGADAADKSSAERPAKAAASENGEARRDNGRRHERRGNKPAEERGDKPAGNRDEKSRENRSDKPREKRPENKQQEKRSENKPQEKRGDRPQREKRPENKSQDRSADKQTSAEKPAITRLPGETIGMSKQEQTAEAPKTASSSSSRRSNLHRKHSFGPRN